MLVGFGRSNVISKARQQPEKVKMVLDKIRTDGLSPTIEAVFNKLDQPFPLGYCNVGTIIESDPAVDWAHPGDRVVSNGPHAQVVRVPANLAARIPDNVTDQEASFTALAAIGLQGIRQINPTLGETIVVTGLGLIGLACVQLLRANGCRVIGIDFDPARLALARSFGAEAFQVDEATSPVPFVESFTNGRGADGVIIAASTDSSEPMHQAAAMCRTRGRIVLVGVSGLELSRNDFYQKELTFQVSCSYGPGRYDPCYEEKNQDYPFGFVRWTARRNFEAVLDLMSSGRLDVKPLISHQFSIDEAPKAYEVVMGSEPSLGILLRFSDQEPTAAQLSEVTRRTVSISPSAPGEPKSPSVSFIGSGNYAGAVLIPAFKAAGSQFRTIASSAGVTGVHNGTKFGFSQTTTDTDSIFDDADTNIVVVATRHNSHAEYAQKAISAGKHVFVEKPLCLTEQELDSLTATLPGFGGLLMIGFNRRFSPLVQQVKSRLETRSTPSSFVYTVNAGEIPVDHWTQDEDIGGGRILGEACHFIDLLRFLAAAPIADARIAYMAGATRDTACISLEFANGSIGTINYFANGSKSFPKERIEVFSDGGVLQIDNFRKLRAFGWSGAKNQTLWRQDKGQNACAAAFVQAVRDGGPCPIPLDEILEVSRISIQLGRSASK